MAIAGGGFSFVPRTDIRGTVRQQMISELFSNRTQVLMRIQKKDGTQPYTLAQQLPEYKQRLLGNKMFKQATGTMILLVYVGSVVI